MDAAEDNDAGEAVPPFALMSDRLRKDGETDFVMGTDGVQLMAFLGAVEEDLSVHKRVIDRQAIGVSVLSHDGENTARGRLENGQAFLFRGSLPESADRSEIGHTQTNIHIIFERTISRRVCSCAEEFVCLFR